MQIIFLDESGQPGGFDKENKKLGKNVSRYFTLGGFMIDADNILEIERKLREIKMKYKLNSNHEIKWHSTYSKLGLNYEQYKNMKLEVIRTISEYRASVIGIVVDKEECYKNKEYINDSNDLYAVALHLLMERYSMEIKNKHQVYN